MKDVYHFPVRYAKPKEAHGYIYVYVLAVDRLMSNRGKTRDRNSGL